MNIDSISAKIESNAHHFIESIKEEARGTRDAAEIIGKYIKEHKITEEEDRILKTQLWNTLKIFGIGIPFIFIPGASVLIPILVRVAKKRNIELLPSSFNKKYSEDGISIDRSLSAQQKGKRSKKP